MSVFGLSKAERDHQLRARLTALTEHHDHNCPPYSRLIRSYGYAPGCIHQLHDVPFIPARMFKTTRLTSVPEDAIVKTLVSSGTSGDKSVIALDRLTATAQSRALMDVVGDFIGKSRLPMLIIDASSTLSARGPASARAAGIAGFSIFSKSRTFALNDDFEPDLDAIETFLDAHGDQPFLVFGFTFLIWQGFCAALAQAGVTLDLGQGRLFHGGGWKKLADKNISNTAFKEKLADVAGITRVHNYYGMVEQTGSIMVECEHARLHLSKYSDVIARRPHDFSPCALGEPGLLQTLSTLPESYPGHSILTEDVGAVAFDDTCPCGRIGKAIEIHGRVAKAEVRGCSDAYV